MKYEIIYYKDVWGNAEDGWTVNDVETHYNKDDIEITEDMSDEEIIKAIRADKHGEIMLIFYKDEEITVGGDDERIEIESEGYPICALVKEGGTE